jgi:hypothetical protein
MDWTAGVTSSTEANISSFSLRIQTKSEVHPASYPIDSEGLFSEVNLGTDHLSSSVEVNNE